MWNQQAGRAMSVVLLAVIAAIAVSWLGFVALVVLCVLWPASVAPEVLLAAWLAAIVVAIVRPGGARRRLTGPSLILFAPLAPFALAGAAAVRVNPAPPGRQDDDPRPPP
jgi:hypothetical protein